MSMFERPAPAPDEAEVARRPERAGIAGAYLLAFSALSILCSLLLLFAGSGVAHFVGYVLAAPVPFVLIALRRRMVVRRRELHGLVEPSGVELLTWLLFAAGLVLALVHGFQFAYEAAR